MSPRSLVAFCHVVILSCLVALPDAEAKGERGLVLETHVSARPRDADYLLAPLLDELKRSGFRASSVAGTRIHSLHSISSAQLSNKQIELARRAIKDGFAAYVDLRFEGAVDAATRGLGILMNRPATMARQQQVREYMYEALITISMANSRLGKTEALAASMGEFIRSFPDRDVSRKKYGPEGIDLYRKINKEMSAHQKGELQIAAGPGSMIFVNERYVGIGSLKLEVFPGRYRIYTQNGPQAGRVHIVDVEAERTHTLVVDAIVDKSVRTDEGFVGFIFEDEAERSQHERRVTLELGRAIGAENIILVGFHKFKGRESIVASSIVIESGESGPSARVPLPKNGAPSASQLRALAAFVAGAGPASPDIEVLTVKVAASAEGSGTTFAAETSVRARSPDTGISSGWRWSSWIAGAATIGAGGYLLSIDGKGTCTLEPGQLVCPENYETKTPAIGLIAGGTALGLLGFYLWTHEDPGGGTRVSVRPSEDGWTAGISGGF